MVDEFLGLNDVVRGNNGGEDVPVLLDPLPLVCDRRGAREGTLHGRSSSFLGPNPEIPLPSVLQFYCQWSHMCFIWYEVLIILFRFKIYKSKPLISYKRLK